jgi:hypothetical protein
LNVTVPVGVPEPGSGTVTVAVNNTPCPNAAQLELDASDVAVPAGPTAAETVCANVVETLDAKLPSVP